MPPPSTIRVSTTCYSSIIGDGVHISHGSSSSSGSIRSGKGSSSTWAHITDEPQVEDYPSLKITFS